MLNNTTNTQVKQQTLKNGNPINRERQFGQPNGNKQGKGFWKKENTPRFKLEQMLMMDENEIVGIINDKTRSLFERKVTKSLFNEESFKGLELMINQVYGPPKQKIDLDYDNDEHYNISFVVKDFRKE
ncbi:hypothetical protein J6V85_01620 [Candidatus Saccharibacteria bacterium]|nr:hypothetical protein [Candidatus Saccharibacteria bacterium]